MSYESRHHRLEWKNDFFARQIREMLGDTYADTSRIFKYKTLRRKHRTNRFS